MTHSVCPYCRAAIDPSTEELLICTGCDTPHHRDCFEENRGCTVFGCKCAPADEPKLRVSPPELTAAGAAAAPSPAFGTPGLSASSSTAEQDSTYRHRSKMTYIMLGVLLGALGAHNFYAGYRKKALYQFGLTALTMGYGAPMIWIWAIIEICTVERDNEGMEFSS